MPKSCGHSLWPGSKGDKLLFSSGLAGLTSKLRLIVCVHTEEPKCHLTLRDVENATTFGDCSVLQPFFSCFAQVCLFFFFPPNSCCVVLNTCFAFSVT